MEMRSKTTKREHEDHFKKREGRVDRPTEKEGNCSLGSNLIREQFAPTMRLRKSEGGWK